MLYLQVRADPSTVQGTLIKFPYVFAGAGKQQITFGNDNKRDLIPGFPRHLTNHDLKQSASRAELISMLRGAFPHLSPSDQAVGQQQGGRVAALAVLGAIKPQAYERSRNFLNGEVTRLSPYLRHGVLTLAEVRDVALDAVAKPEFAGKLVNELAWRDYWQRLYFQIGAGVWQDREEYKTGFAASQYSSELPGDLAAGNTTLACMDGFSHQLIETGYLHNHARMWVAAYLVHWRHVDWRAGARWFLEHLLDGDPASNNLSWQWVASTFSSKPYFFNRENLERYTAGEYCARCPHAQAHTCPFDRSYEALESELFPMLGQPTSANPPLPRTATSDAPAEQPPPPDSVDQPLIWLHADALNPASELLARYPHRPAIFTWDAAWIRDERPTLKRLVYIAECLREFSADIQISVGEVASDVLAAAKATGSGYILAQRTPDPRLRAAADALREHLPVVWYDPPPLVEAVRAFDLKRFSRYWQRAQASAMQPTRVRQR